MRTSQLQIRVTPAEKLRVQRAARKAGLGMSAYVLGKVLPRQDSGWLARLQQVLHSGGARIAVAELSGWLAGLSAMELRDAVQEPPPGGLEPATANTVAAMVEHLCALRGLPLPAWTLSIAPLRQPLFGSTLGSLRLHLLTHSPAAYRRRNLFVDTATGGQV